MWILQFPSNLETCQPLFLQVFFCLHPYPGTLVTCASVSLKSCNSLGLFGIFIFFSERFILDSLFYYFFNFRIFSSVPRSLLLIPSSALFISHVVLPFSIPLPPEAVQSFLASVPDLSLCLRYPRPCWAMPCPLGGLCDL